MNRVTKFLQNRVALTLILAFTFLVGPAVTTGAVWTQSVGLLPGSAVVFASNAPATDRYMAAVAKAFYGNRVGLADGVADDVEMQAANTALPATGWQRILLVGSFTNAAAVSLDRDYTIFELRGTITAAAAGATNTVNVVGSNITVTGGVYDYNSSTSAAISVNPAAAAKNNVHIEKTEIKNVGALGVAISFGQNTTYLWIENNYIHDSNHGIIGSGVVTSGTAHINILNNRINDTGKANGYHAIYVNYVDYLVVSWNIIKDVTHNDSMGIKLGADTNFATVSYNKIENAGLDAIQWTTSHDASIVYNYINTVRNAGAKSIDINTVSNFAVDYNIIYGSTALDSIASFAASDGSISHNTISGNTAAKAGAGILHNDGARVNIEANIITEHGNANYPMKISTSASTDHVALNQLSNNYAGFPGIYVFGDNNLFESNNITGSDYGIQIAASADGTQVLDNNLAGYGTAPILDGGTNTKILGNYAYIAPGEVRTASGSLVATGSTLTDGTGTFTGSVITLKPGANTVVCTVAGTATIVLPAGSTGTAATGTMTVNGSPVALVAGNNTITTSGVVGNIVVTINAWTFAWHNPELQDILVKKVTVEVTTTGGTATSVLQVGIADNATGTNIGTEYFPAAGADLNALAVLDSWNATDTGAQTKAILLQDSASATDGWIVGKINVEVAQNLVAKYYIEFVGR